MIDATTPAFADEHATCARDHYTGEDGAQRHAQILYLVYREGLGPVFSSQVLSRLVSLAETGWHTNLAVFVPIGEFFRRALRHRWRDIRARIDDTLPGRLSRLPSPPSRARWAWNEARLLSIWLRCRYARRDALILHCRNPMATILALRAKKSFPKARVVFDCRGISHAEYLYQNASQVSSADNEAVLVEADQRQNMEIRAAREADAIVCVSEAMAEYVVSEWDVPPDKITVIPCCVDVQGFSEASSRRHATRAELSLSDRLVVAYCGSLHRWQVPERSLETFRQIGQLHSNAHLLSITTHPERMRHLAQEQGLSTAELTVLSVPHSEVPRYLAAADLGLLLRERSLVNRVASPVKLGEYLASGLPVIMSDEIGDYSDLARRENVGLVLPCDGNHRSVEAQLRGFLDAYWACPETWRARCREVARVHLDSAVHLPKIAALYDRLSREGSE